MDPIVELEHVSTQLGGVTIHRDISLRVHSDEVLAVIGGSGSGKTTLMRLMLGLARPSSGTVRVFGKPLGNCGEATLHDVRRRWGVLFQQGALFSALTVFDNIALPLRELGGVPRDVIEALVLQKLTQVGLSPRDAPKMPAELSGGMVKRVALARALVLDPQLLFLDEPTAGLDPMGAKQFVRLIETLRAEMKLTVVMITHDVETLLALADRVAVLADRQIVALGALARVVESQHPFVREFFLGQQWRCQDQALREFRDTMARVPDASAAES
ncbi:MAG: ATP-binding cassette domain-containing protein [Paucibacter sp.]|nr:ATP-binding cassette domain-containing protein [Roseateles sp.]